MMLPKTKERSFAKMAGTCAVFFVAMLFLGSCSSSSSGGLGGAYQKAVGSGDETSTIQSLRTIATAEAQLKVSRGSYGNFDALVQAGLLDVRFSCNTPNLKGYRFTLSATDSEFAVNADPQTTESQPTTGSRHFYLDSFDNAVRVNPDRPASRTDPAL